MPSQHVTHFDASPDEVAAKARETLVVTGPAGPEATLRGEIATDHRTAVDLTVHLAAEPDGGTTATFRCVERSRIPYFQWAMAWVLGRGEREALTHAVERVGAALDGRPEPSPPRRHALAPPVPFDDHQARSLAVICAAAAVAGLGSGLFSANINFITDAFGASDFSTGVAGAVTRVGLLLSLVATALADRRGRRQILLFSVGGVAAAGAASAIAPNLIFLTGAQLFARGFFNAAFAVAAIAVVEEAPEGARAFALALLTLAVGFGQAFSVAMLPVADLGTEAWRASFAVSGVTIVLLPGLARRMTETLRFERLERRHAPTGHPRELLSPRYRSRFLLLMTAALLTQVLAAPAAQYTNRFLGDERGYSGFDVGVFRAVTSVIPPIIGLFLGGRLAEAWGRKRLAIPGKIVASVATVAFFVSVGPMIWVTGTVEIFLVALIAPALAAFGPELFPTEVRGTANAVLLIAGVTGSAIGLIGVGALSDSTSLGTAIGWAAIAPVISALFILPRLPEASHRDLDVVSPPEV